MPLILLGEARQRFLKAAKKNGVKNIVMCDGSFEDAVRLAYGMAKPPQVVLLSPACSSYDMFANLPNGNVSLSPLSIHSKGSREEAIMKVLIVGGGTGSHIYLTLLMPFGTRSLMRKSPLSGRVRDSKGILFPDMDIRWNLSASPGLNAIWVWNAQKRGGSGQRNERRLQPANRIEPDLVIGTGGYVCGPVALAP